MAGALCTGITIYYISGYQDQHRAQRTEYEQRITELEQIQQEQQIATRVAWAPLRDIPPGHMIAEKDLMEVKLSYDGMPADLPVGKKDIAGKGVKIALSKGTPITTGMLFQEEPTPADLRHREMRAVYLPSSMKQGDMVDVRIQFPTGQDYIVLSKKKVDKLQSPAFWTTISEQEILLLSSALVDAHLHQATLYALQYVEPQLQNRAVPNYPPNAEVTRLIANNPNIVKQAERGLEIAIRELLESDLGERREGSHTQVSDMPIHSSINNSVRTPDSWSSASSLPLDPSYSAAGRAEEYNEPETRTQAKAREDADREAEQILGGTSSTSETQSTHEDQLDDELIFSSP